MTQIAEQLAAGQGKILRFLTFATLWQLSGSRSEKKNHFQKISTPKIILCYTSKIYAICRSCGNCTGQELHPIIMYYSSYVKTLYTLYCYCWGLSLPFFWPETLQNVYFTFCSSNRFVKLRELIWKNHTHVIKTRKLAYYKNMAAFKSNESIFSNSRSSESSHILILQKLKNKVKQQQNKTNNKFDLAVEFPIFLVCTRVWVWSLWHWHCSSINLCMLRTKINKNIHDSHFCRNHLSNHWCEVMVVTSTYFEVPFTWYTKLYKKERDRHKYYFQKIYIYEVLCVLSRRHGYFNTH